MAGVSQTVIDNARALELYLRASPEAASFLDCFTSDDRRPATELCLRYDHYSPGDEQIRLAQGCTAHLKRALDAAAHALGARIESDLSPRQQVDHDAVPEGATVKPGTEKPYVGIHTAIALDHPGVKDVLLEQAALIINAERAKDKEYGMAYFAEDDAQLREKLHKGFDHDVTPAELAALSQEMGMLSAVMRARKQDAGMAGPGPG